MPITEEWNQLTGKQKMERICLGIPANRERQIQSLRGSDKMDYFITASYYGAYLKFACKYLFVDDDIEKAKLNFYKVAECTDKLVKVYNEDVLSGQGLMRMFYTLLSDHHALIKSFATLRHPQYEEQLKLGLMSPIAICQSLLIDDWNGFEQAMSIMQKKKIIEKWKMQLDWEYYNAVAKKDKGRIEEILHELLKPKEFNRRNKHEILMREFIAYPVLGYAKLAWYKGIEVEVDHPLVPKELLPVKPLKNYDQAPVFPGADWE